MPAPKKKPHESTALRFVSDGVLLFCKCGWRTDIFDHEKDARKQFAEHRANNPSMALDFGENE